MHAAAWGALRTTRRPQLWRSSCRVVAGVRRPLPSSSARNFHRSAIAYRIPDDPADPKTGAENGSPKNTAEEESNAAPGDAASGEPVVAKTDTATSGQRTKRGDYGSAARRANRNVRVKEVPPMVLPEWFLEHNVRPSGARDNVERILLLEDRTAPEKEQKLVESATIKTGDEPAPTPEESAADSALGSDGKVRYSMKNIVFQELQSNIEAILSIRPPKGIDPKEIIRPDILLQCPQRDASGFMNQVVDTVAFKLNADVVRLDPDDIAQIVGEYMGENLAWTPCTTSLLGYELDKVGRYEEEMNRGEEEDDLEMDEGEDPQKPELPSLSALTSALKAGSSKLRGLTIIPGAGAQRSLSKPMSFDELFGQGPNQSPTRSTSSSESWSNFKLTAALEALVDASYNTAAKSTSATSSTDPSSAETPSPKPTIIQINQYKEMGKIDAGINILKMLRDIVKKRWLEGRHIAIIGTTTAGDPVPATTLDSIVQLQSDVVFGDQRTIMVTPAKTQDMEALKIDEKHRNRRVNIRHLKDMVSKLSNGEAAPLIDNIVENFLSTRNVAPPSEPQVWSDLHTRMVEDLEESIWPYPRVHRLATVMIGSSSIDLTHAGNSSLLAAYDIIGASDEEKALWMKKDDRKKSSTTTSSSKDTLADQKRRQIKVNATLREKKLLGGVVHPENIKVTFSDVRAPADTIDALKTLTSLSLVRPEAFSYGVLAKDKIPGVLLYGPPGTGKTMLAKALAKESDTTVLEVSGSEIYDKYVGEGEKNVKAVFSLAKKLAPCIVFIDEADAIFGDRGAGSQRTSHREIINEFLREWDGMNDLSAFIMVATNRPFDLDEAILRRLPRRLLIDLPVEADREAILKIHLQGEDLEAEVDLAALAANTPFYSGSDLKNLSVAAALACVREETTTATAAAASSAAAGEDVSALSKNLSYPAKRTIGKRHFDIAIQEISASVSEDMATLAAIRKFDERYGDRKGRKKKTAMGFGREREGVDEEGARVRQREVGRGVGI